MTKPKRVTKTTRIRRLNERKILDAGLKAFGQYGYGGATVNQIADLASMSRSNLLYYFDSKKALYAAVLSRTLETWIDPLEHINPEGEPIDEIWAYAQAKLEMSRTQSAESRLFAMEILQGAPVIRDVLQTRLKNLVNARVKLIQMWIKQGRLAPVDPLHLLFTIWAATQTYADFWPQIEILTRGGAGKKEVFAAAEKNLRLLLTSGLKPR